MLLLVLFVLSPGASEGVGGCPGAMLTKVRHGDELVEATRRGPRSGDTECCEARVAELGKVSVPV